MKEQNFINIIKEQTNNKYIGDDCAHIKELGIVITQDNFIEDVHFKTAWATPYQIGYKAAAVNISDVLASGAKPVYITVGLSIPKNSDETFIKELYSGIIAGSYGAEIVGGDITSAEKICISITAIGKCEGRKISSRKNAKIGHSVIISEKHGDSAIGLKELFEGKKKTPFIRAHLEPIPQFEFSEDISTQITTDYAMMDTSDGLADALFQIAKSSNVKIKVEETNGIFGFEDYKLVATVPTNFLSKIKNYIKIGEVLAFDGNYLQIGNKNYNNYDELNLYNHFS